MNDLLFGEGFWQLAKYPIIFLIILYFLFAVVVVKQTKLMTKTLEVNMEKVVLTISYVHLAFTVGVLFLAIFIL